MGYSNPKLNTITLKLRKGPKLIIQTNVRLRTSIVGQPKECVQVLQALLKLHNFNPLTSKLRESLRCTKLLVGAGIFCSKNTCVLNLFFDNCTTAKFVIISIRIHSKGLTALKTSNL